MENSKLIGGNSYINGSYDITVMPHSDKKVDLYIRDNFKMEIFQVKGYELNKINIRALEDALKRNRKDITCSFSESNCDGQELLELIITIEMPLLPKINETIFLAKTKTLKDSEVINAKLLDIKKAILKNQQTLNDVSKSFGGKVVKYFDHLTYASATKDIVASLIIPTQGKYLITVSSFLKGNANTYLNIQLSKGDICPGTYYGIPTTTQSNPMAYFVRTVIDVTEDNYSLNLTGTSGTSYRWQMNNLLMTAEKISAK